MPDAGNCICLYTLRVGFAYREYILAASKKKQPNTVHKRKSIGLMSNECASQLENNANNGNFYERKKLIRIQLSEVICTGGHAYK
jgi:hypothetical protein